jgi:hypothetical protein
MTTTTAIVAHAGGTGWWDELLCLLPVPVLFVVFLILGARSRHATPGDDTDPPENEQPPAIDP